jgi:hypothetical protein
MTGKNNVPLSMGFTEEDYEWLKDKVERKYGLVETDSSMKYGRAIADYIRALVSAARKKDEKPKKKKSKKKDKEVEEEVVLVAETAEEEEDLFDGISIEDE